MWSETNQAVCSYCILLCFSILHQTVASDFLLQIRRWGTYIINFLCISCQIFVVYFKVEVWDFNVLTVVGIMFTNNHCGNLLLQEHSCCFRELRLSHHFSVREKQSFCFKDYFLFEGEACYCLKNAVLLPPFGKYRN